LRILAAASASALAERAVIEAALAEGRVSGPEMADAGQRLNHIAAEAAMLEERRLQLQTQLDETQR
jgi:ATP-binding cassette subfamily F protein 3